MLKENKDIHVVIFDRKISSHKFMTYANKPFCPKLLISHATNIAQFKNEFASNVKVTFPYILSEYSDYFKQNSKHVDLVNIIKTSLMRCLFIGGKTC